MIFGRRQILRSLQIAPLAMASLKTLLEQLVDYAGLFPPAGLPVASVVKNYEKYLAGSHRWMLGRLIIPAGQLEEFAKVFQQLLPESVAEPWLVSALIPGASAPDNGLARALDHIARFNEQHEFARVDVVEGKLPTADLAAETVRRIPDSLTAFLEVPFADSEPVLTELAEHASPGVFAKIRTGGVTPELIPNPQQVADFIAGCARTGLGFKATAGLHHPLRGEYPLTYDTDPPRDTMHGFLNVFIAACFANCRGYDSEELTRILNATSTESFGFLPDSITWEADQIEVPEIRKTREQFAISFGSCSFTEPVEELTRPDWLEADTAESTT